MTKRLTQKRFDQLARQTRLSDRSLARARRVLVDGETPQDVATSEGVSSVVVQRVVRMVAGSRRKQDRLTERQFDEAITKLPRMNTRNQALSRRVLVHGERVADLAREANISPKTIWQAVDRVRAKARPDGWRQVTVVLPEHLADEVEAMEQEALEGLNDPK